MAEAKIDTVDSEVTWDTFISRAKLLGYPVVVHFTATWCMPSVAMNPFFEQLVSTHQNIMFLLVDVDEVKEVASKMEIKAMPTFVMIKDGIVVDKLVGANPDEIKKRVAALLHNH